jgi:monofunctional glycosyltransferase
MSARVGSRLLKGLVLVAVAIVAVTALPVLLLRFVAPPTSAFMLESALEARQARERDYRTDYRWVDLEAISPNAALAVIASEDQLFPYHAGFDLKSIREAVRANAHRRHPRGASTISQQVAKNLFLWSGPSYLRKGLEAWLTVLIEACWPKERILEVYLNIAQFGRGIYGVEAASRRFFHHPAARLTRAEAALLAAVLPSPLRLHPERPSSYLSSRQEWILAQMRDLGGASYLEEIDARPAPELAHGHSRR